MAEIHLVVDDTRLMIAPTHPAFEQMLRYEHKSLVSQPGQPWNRVTKREERLLYLLKEKEGITALITHHGFLHRVVQFCVRCRWPVKFGDEDDRRTKLPPPLLNNMHGFRFSQKALLEKFLLADCSGCLKAPTRYGKSTLIVNTMRAYPGITTVFTCPGEDLLRQSVKDFKAAMPERDIRMLGAGSSNRISGPDITICSMDSLHLCDYGKVRLLIVDEPHALMTDGRIPQLNKFQFARRLSFGATLEGRFDGRDLVLEGLLGPVLAERTYEEAVKEGAICPLVILLLKVNLHRKAVTGKRDQVYKHTIFESPEIASMMANICRLMPDDWQHLVFIRQEVQADLIQEALGDDTPIAMAKVLKKKVRAQMAQDMRFNNLRRCISSDIFATGVTFHDIRCVVNASGGAGNISSIQKPGRLAEVRPNKKCGVMIDFLYLCDENPKNCLTIDSWSRHKVYKAKGYDVRVVGSVEELNNQLKSCR